MIKSILTQIWNQRRLNGWIFAELLIVFVLLWYCLDMLYAFAYAERQPKGYDLEHVYKSYFHESHSVGALFFRR